MASTKDISTLTLAILGLIARNPCSAYDVRKIFETTPMGHFSASPGAIYPALKRIEENGWVSGRVANANTLRPKRVYRLTKTGRKVLVGRVSQPITPDDVRQDLDDFMLRFVFMDKLLSHERIVDLLGQFKSEMRSYRSYLRKLLEPIRNDLTVCEQLSMEHGIARAEKNVVWAKRAIERIRKQRA